MRLALSIAVSVIAAGSAFSEDMPSDRQKEAIRAYWGSELVGKVCPGYRKNEYQVLKFLDSYGMSANDVRERFNSFSHITTDEIAKWAVSDLTDACDSLEGLLGEHGKFPNLVERR